MGSKYLVMGPFGLRIVILSNGGSYCVSKKFR